MQIANQINWLRGEEPPQLICGDYLQTCGWADGAETGPDCTQCPDSVGGDDTSSEPAHAALAIECDEPRTGQIEYREYLHFSFENSIERDVAFSTCFSSIDTTLFLFDANGNDEIDITSRSSNGCNGDDCHDESLILFSDCAARTETFTMRSLPIGHYVLRLSPFSSGGGYDLRVACDPVYVNDSEEEDEDQITDAGDIECGVPRTGQIADADCASGETYFSFTNSVQRDVSFSTCFSEIDTTLRLYDANGNDEIDITSQSTNRCDGDDCNDESVFSGSDCYATTETFTMSALDIGQYTLHLRPFSSGGRYDVRVICDAADTDTNINSARMDAARVDVALEETDAETADDEDKSYITGDIECGKARTGQITSGDWLYFTFENSIERDVSFSTCFSSINTSLFLLDANNHEIGVTRDACETFTMASLDIGQYEVGLHPDSSGSEVGSYDLRVICDAAEAALARVAPGQLDEYDGDYTTGT